MIKILDDFELTTDNRDYIVYHLPPTSQRESFIRWKQDHKEEIDEIRNTAKKQPSRKASAAQSRNP